MKNRVSFFVDGFNLYHGICKISEKSKWLDLKKLCLSFLKDDEIIADVYYFSAIAFQFNDEGKVIRHKKYIEKLKQNGVIVKLGKFKKKDKFCPLCKKQFQSHEEKQTDVNIALQIVCDAFEDKFDTAILVSGDTDMIPAIEKLKDLSNKKIGVLFPPQRVTKELKNAVDFSIKITKSGLEKNLFDLADAPCEWK